MIYSFSHFYISYNKMFPFIFLIIKCFLIIFMLNRKLIEHDNCSEVNNIEKESRKRKFCHLWLENKQFYGCKQSRRILSIYFCSFCNLKLRCDFDKLMHSDSKKHVLECRKRGSSVDLNTHDEELVPFENRKKKITKIKFTV